MAQAASPEMLSLKIKCLKSEHFDIQISAEASVDDLKEEIHSARDVEPARQRIIYKGKVLKSGKTLKDYKIGDQTTIHLVIRKQPNPNPRNDEVTAENSTTTRSNSNNTGMSTGTAAIS